MMVPSKRIFLWGLGGLAGILLLYGLLRWKLGVFLPPVIDKNLPDAVMFLAVGVMLWNRKIRKDEEKKAAEKKAAEEAALAEKLDPETPEAAGHWGESGEKSEDAQG